MAELDPTVYTVAWLAPLEIEAQAALHLLDNIHHGKFPMAPGDDYIFQAGDICGHNVIIATIPPGQAYGTGSAAALASQVKRYFPKLWFGLLVGVAAGLPNLLRNPPLDIRLGDVLVGLATGDSAGLIAYDLGKETGKDGFQLLRFGHGLDNTETVVRSAIGSIKLRAPNDASLFLQYHKHIENKEHSCGTFIDPGQDKDTLYQFDKDDIENVVQRERRPDSKRTRVWYGPIGSGEKLMKNARKRNELRDKYNIIGLEMEAAGTMNCIPVGVIRGVCDYGDKHKNKEWQPYAAAMAAAYAKAVLAEIRPDHVTRETIMGVRLKRKLDEEYIHLIPDGGRRKRSNCAIHASENSIQEGLTFDSYSHGTQMVHHWRCAQNKCTERSSLQVDESIAETSTVTKETLTPTARSSHIIDAVTKQSLIDQLYFDKIDERLMHLTAAQGITCRWFLTKPEYISWRNEAQHLDHGGFLWIKGNPGTGKSTLMKFLFERTKLDAKGNLSQMILSFFFLARGTVEEKSTTGLYRSLLHQLFEKAPETIDSLEWMTADGAKVVQRNGWHEEALKQTLAHAVQELGSRSLTIFVDALDECNQHQVADMVSFFEELCDSAKEVQVKLQVCFSSRHYPTVIIEKGIEVILEDEIGHTDDIQQYIKSKLRMGKSNQAESLRSEILTKSSGIFLWVVLVLDIFNREYPNSTVSVKKMRDRLREIPPKLNDLFQMILTRDGENLDQLQVCLKWILYAIRPLKPQELYFAVQFGCNKGSSGVWDKEDIGLNEMKTYVRSSSKGLAEVTRNKASEVQFIHESVRDFLLGNYGDQWSEVSDNLAGHSHELLKNCCLAQLTSQGVDMPKSLPKASEATELRSDVNSKFPFLEYTVLNLFYHANEAQKNGIGQRGFLSNAPLQRWIFINNALERFDIRRYTESASLLYILSEKNLSDLIRIHPQKESYFDVGDERYGTPIFAALANNSCEAARAFLKAQADILPQESPFHGLYQQYCQDRNSKPSIGRDFVFTRKKDIIFYLITHTPEIFLAAFLCSGKADENSVNSSDRTPLSYAAERGHETIVKLLLARDGIDINNNDGYSQTPLSHAAEGGHETIVKLLLAHGGIDINSKGSSHRTPLSSAAKGGHEAIVKLLLAYDGIDINSKGSSYWSPLSYAAERGHEAIVKLLLARDGIDINSKGNFGRTPLSVAAKSGHEAIVKLLLDYNANIESMDTDSSTPLSWAAANGHHAVVKLLLDYNANMGSMDASGRTPPSWAVQNGHFDVVELLKSHEQLLL